jgi:hypothetical protein
VAKNTQTEVEEYTPPLLDLTGTDGVVMKNAREVGFYIAGQWDMWRHALATKDLIWSDRWMNLDLPPGTMQEVQAKFEKQYLGGALAILVTAGSVVSVVEQDDEYVTISVL